MLKKILLVSAITSVTTGVALANPAPYVGASVGLTNNFANTKVANQNGTFGSYRGVPFSVFAGYGGVVCQNFYLAGELTGTFATADLSDNKFFKTSYGFGASVLPGVMLSDHTLAYARLGAVRTHFGEYKDHGDNKTGGQFGLGLQTNLTQNLDLRGEYDYVAYKSITTTVDSGPLKGKKFTLSPRADQVSLSLVYKFD